MEWNNRKQFAAAAACTGRAGLPGLSLQSRGRWHVGRPRPQQKMLLGLAPEPHVSRPERAGACGFAACTCCAAGLTPFGERTQWEPHRFELGPLTPQCWRLFGRLARWPQCCDWVCSGVRVLRAWPCRAGLLSYTWAGTRPAPWLGRCTHQKACSGQMDGRGVVRCERSLCRACCLWLMCSSA